MYVYQINSWLNMFELYFLENKALNGKILFNII